MEGSFPATTSFHVLHSYVANMSLSVTPGLPGHQRVCLLFGMCDTTCLVVHGLRGHPDDVRDEA
jgi:hypothetical protein